jgi:inosose dehydratase
LWVRGGRVDKSREVFEQAFAEFADVGLTAVMADMPDGMTAPKYAAWIDSYGLAPSLSLFSYPFDETIPPSRAAASSGLNAC